MPSHYNRTCDVPHVSPNISNTAFKSKFPKPGTFLETSARCLLKITPLRVFKPIDPGKLSMPAALTKRQTLSQICRRCAHLVAENSHVCADPLFESRKVVKCRKGTKAHDNENLRAIARAACDLFR